MRRAIYAVLVPVLGSLACAGSRPPPQSCELPPKEEKTVEIGACSVDEPPQDAGADGDAP